MLKSPDQTLQSMYFSCFTKAILQTTKYEQKNYFALGC